MQRVAPSFEVRLNAPRPGDRPAIGQVHVIFQIPAQVLVVVISQEGRKRNLDAEHAPIDTSKPCLVSPLSSSGEEDAQFIHRGFLPPHLVMTATR